jgi:hypothetical protein
MAEMQIDINQPMNDNKNLANTIAYQMINNFPPVYVDVKDVNNQQNILAQTINRVNCFSLPRILIYHWRN